MNIDPASRYSWSSGVKGSMIRYPHMHRILIQAKKGGFLEEALFELGLAGLGEERSMGASGGISG